MGNGCRARAQSVGFPQRRRVRPNVLHVLRGSGSELSAGSRRVGDALHAGGGGDTRGWCEHEPTSRSDVRAATGGGRAVQRAAPFPHGGHAYVSRAPIRVAVPSRRRHGPVENDARPRAASVPRGEQRHRQVRGSRAVASSGAVGVAVPTPAPAPIAALRAIDWRFLLPQSSRGRWQRLAVLGGPVGVLRRTIASDLADEVTGELAVPGAADLVVAYAD